MKDPSSFLGKSDLTKRKLCKVVMQTEEPASTQKDTERMVKILHSNYARAYLNQIYNNATQTNYGYITLLLSFIKDFEDLFDGTLGDWATDTVNLELKIYYIPFNSRYYPVPRINK